jgi:cytochrome b561
MFLLIAVAAISIEVREAIPKGTDLRSELKNLHIFIGQLVLIFLFVRVITRLSFKQPLPESKIDWHINLMKLVHVALYVLMMAIPITGILLLQAGAKEVSFLGYVLPEIISPDRQIKKIVKEIHELLSNSLYLLVALHIAASLWHHYVIRDGSLKRMLR